MVLRLRHRRDLRVVFGLPLRIGRLLVLQVLLGIGLLEDLQARELQQRGGVAALVESILLGLLGDHLAANQVVEQLGALIGGELGGRLAGGVLDVDSRTSRG